MWNTIRKFGPEYSDLPTMIWNVNILLRFLTLNVDPRSRTPIPLNSYLLNASCAACYYYSYLFSMLWFVFWRSPQTGDLPAAMVAGSLGVSSQIATIKLLYMIVRGQSVQCLVEQCLASDILSEPGTRFYRNMRKALKKVKIRAVSFWICIMTISVLYVTIPMFLPGRHLPEDMYVIYGLEPSFETPNFEISYAIMFSCVLYICYITCTITAFIIIIIGFTDAQMLSLSQEIHNIWEDSVQDAIQFRIDHLLVLSEHVDIIFDDDTRTKINLGVRRRLIHILRNHSRNVMLLRDIDEFLKIPNAVAFYCLGISLIAELLGGLENTYLQVPFTFVQVAMDCYTGQRIMDASITFERAVYSCKWENFDKDNMRIVLLMLQNSQKTLTVSVGGMTVLNFACLMSIVRSVYSTYTTLRSMI